jgi:hypothetical protein
MEEQEFKVNVQIEGDLQLQDGYIIQHDRDLVQ